MLQTIIVPNEPTRTTTTSMGFQSDHLHYIILYISDPSGCGHVRAPNRVCFQIKSLVRVGGDQTCPASARACSACNGSTDANRKRDAFFLLCGGDQPTK
jgi:hypothetical protein